MYTISQGVVLHFAHHVRGHDGPCISLHGHTWRFDVALQADELDAMGFVYDFDKLHEHVLVPCFEMLDHSLAVGAETWAETSTELAAIGEKLVASRVGTIGSRGEPQEMFEGELEGARNERPGGIKVAVFPFTPSSERLAKWLFDVTASRVADERVSVAWTKVYETLHPTVSVAEYRP